MFAAVVVSAGSTTFESQAHGQELTGASSFHRTEQKSGPELADACDRLTRTGRVPTCAAVCTDPQLQLACARSNRRGPRARARTGAATSSSLFRWPCGKTKKAATSERASSGIPRRGFRGECADESERKRRKERVQRAEKERKPKLALADEQISASSSNSAEKVCARLRGNRSFASMVLDTCCASSNTAPQPAPLLSLSRSFAASTWRAVQTKSTCSALTFQLRQAST